MQFRILDADEGDINFLPELDAQIFGEAAYRPGQWVHEINSAASVIYLAFDTSQTQNWKSCGFISAGITGDDLEIHKLGVLPAYRRKNLARELLQHAVEKSMGTQPSLRCILEVAHQNAPALAFYEALNFKEFWRRKKYYANGDDAILMERFFEPAP